VLWLKKFSKERCDFVAGLDAKQSTGEWAGHSHRPPQPAKSGQPSTLTNSMTTIAASFRRFTFRRNRAARSAPSVNDLCVTATIEAKIPGFSDYVLIDPGLATGSEVVWNSALGRYVSGAVQRGELLRITGGTAGTTLGFVQSTGTCPTIHLPVSGTGYCNTSISVTRNTTVKQMNLRVSSAANARDVYSSQKSVPIVRARQS